MNKSGLVIQGPLLSRGLTGSTYQNWGSESLEDIVDYDCVPNIIRIFKEQKQYFDHIIIVVWKTESPVKIQFIADCIGLENIFLIDDDTPHVAESNTLTPKNNHFRQFYSTLLGSKCLIELGCNWIAKIRSDQYLNIHQLSLFFNKFDTSNYSKIVIPYFRIDHPYFVMDFYFFGRSDTVIKFCCSFLNSSFSLGNVHQDLFYSFADNFRGKNKIISYKYISLFSGTVIERNFSKYIWDNCFIPGSRDVYQSLEWRGEKFPVPLDKNLLFLEDINFNLTIDKKYFKNIPYIFIRVPLRVAKLLFKYLIRFIRRF